jgi:3-oxoacyl-(acyl-carrier-protein) synthase
LIKEERFCFSEGQEFNFERLNHALKRNAFIYAEVWGLAQAQCLHDHLPADGTAMANCINLATRMPDKNYASTILTPMVPSTRMNDI